jgi:protein-disulfide isomerase
MSESTRTSREKAAAVRAGQERAARRRRWTMIGTVAVILAVIVGGAVWFAGQDPTGQGSDTTTAGSADGVPSGADGFGVVVGTAASPTTAVIYEDFQCPVCGAFEQATSQQVADGIADDKVRIEYRIVSFLDQASANEYSSRAANAAAAVLDTAGPDAFKKFHDTLYANQPEEGTAGPDNDQLVEWAVQAGADRPEVSRKIEEGTFDQWVVDATDAMSKEGVTGTPTIVIDGRKLDPQEGMQRLLAAVG